jgi:hypothetical protein
MSIILSEFKYLNNPIRTVVGPFRNNICDPRVKFKFNNLIFNHLNIFKF